MRRERLRMVPHNRTSFISAKLEYELGKIRTKKLGPWGYETFCRKSEKLTVATLGWHERWRVILSLALMVLATNVSTAQIDYGKPKELEGVGVDERLDSPLPLDLQFRADTGEILPLKRYFDHQKRPVILVLYYSRCPQLCDTVLTGLFNSLKEIPLEAGRDFEVVAVSIDPSESVQQARLAKQKYLALYGRAGAGNGLHFLTGRQQAVQPLADALGFRYQSIKDGREYSHAAVFMIATPDGRLSRYFYGVEFLPSNLRLSLVEASEGKVGSTFDRLLLFCFHYDETAGKYSLVAKNVMMLGGGLTVLLLMFLMVPAWPWQVQRLALTLGMVAGTIPLAAAVIMGQPGLIVVLVIFELCGFALFINGAMRARAQQESELQEISAISTSP